MNKVVAALCLSVVGVCRAGDAPPAWVNSVDTNALRRVLFDYTKNVIRSEWAGEDKSIGGQFPANIGFQFAVVGDRDVTNRVNAILRKTRDAIPRETVVEIEKYNYLGPTLQWLVRSTRQGVTNATSYLEVNATKAVFEEADFNIELLTNKASRLRVCDVPAAVTIRPVFDVEPEYASILPAEPGVDYPDVLPEQTFATPYGIGIVLRAPEAERFFRFFVTNRQRGIEYVWIPSVNNPIYAYKYDPRMSPTNGFAEVRIGSHRQFRRIDVLVCQKFGDAFGPPTYISFYYVPYIKRTYGKKMLVDKIEYVLKAKNPPPYDISPIWIPREWTDHYDYWLKKDILGYNRSLPVSCGRLRDEQFSCRGEYVLAKDISDRPAVVRKTRYYVENGVLKYEPYGEEIKLEGFLPRKRGEVKTGWQK